MLVRTPADTTDGIVAELKLDGKLSEAVAIRTPPLTLSFKLARVQAGTRKAFWAKGAKKRR